VAQNRRRKHHVVSKFYLGGFADSEKQIWRVPLAKGARPGRLGIVSATVREDFYTINRPGQPPDAIEEALGGIENVTAPAFARLIKGRGDPMSQDDRYLIASWIALQFLRSEATRRSGEQIWRQFAKLEVGVSTTAQVRERLGLGDDVSDEEVEGYRARMLANPDALEYDPEHHIQLMGESLEGTTNLVMFREPWIVVRYNHKTLATSDTPVVLIPSDHDARMGMGSGIGSAGELYVPISRQVGLCMGDLPPIDGPPKLTCLEAPGSTQSARWMNQATAFNARRVIFHCPGDAPLEGLKMPTGERLQEIQGTDHQIDAMIRGFAKQQGRPSGLPEDQPPASPFSGGSPGVGVDAGEDVGH
jgi:hypothetical protein